MSDNPRAIDYASPDAYDPYAPARDGASGGAPSPVAMVVRALRGRWIWALGLGGVLAAIGGYCAWRIPTVLYRTAGLIEVQPATVKILNETDENKVHPMFDAYVESQVTLASSRRVIDMAMDSPEWKKLGRTRTDEDIAKFQKRLSAARPSRALYVQVSFEDESPEVAMIAVNAVMEAYMKLVNERELTQGSGRIRVLENRRTALQNQLSDLRTTIQSVTEDRGPEGLRDRCRIAEKELNEINHNLSELDMEIAALRSAGAQAEVAPERVESDQEIALKVPELRQLLDRKAAVEGDLRFLENNEKKGSKHPDVLEKRLELTTVERMIIVRVNAYRAAAGKSPEQRAAALTAKEATHKSFVELREKRNDEAIRLGKKRGQLEQLEAEFANLTEQLGEVKKLLDVINVESQGSIGGRIRIASQGDRPVAPSSDKRASFAGLGAAGGMGLGCAIVLLLGLRDVRMRHISDVDGRASHGRFLGILPDVVPGDTGIESETSAAMGDFSIHHIRTMVQLRSRDTKRVVALTSPSAGAGKTTLSMSLAESYASAGSRTLLIDCDLVGHGLTSVMRSLVCEDASRALVGSVDAGDAPKIVKRHRLSELLAARGRKYDDAQIAELLEAARELAAAGNEACIRTSKALEGLARSTGHGGTGPHKKRGILGALDGVPLEECVLAVAQENLFILPVGDAKHGDAVRLSRDGLARLLAASRERYDTVIIDTGPILGSIEAALVTSVTDSVLLVVTRGERQNLVNDALARLEQIGADIAGVIFNRATIDDFIRSKHVSRSASIPVGVQ